MAGWLDVYNFEEMGCTYDVTFYPGLSPGHSRIFSVQLQGSPST